MSTRTRLSAAISAALLIMALTASAAFAAGASIGAGTLGGSSSNVEFSSDTATGARAAATYTGIVDGGGVTFAFECDGQGIGAAAATSIVGCYLQTGTVTVNAPAGVNLPGNVVATAQTASVAFRDIGDTVTVCSVIRVVPILGADLFVTACVEEGVTITPDGLLDDGDA